MQKKLGERIKQAMLKAGLNQNQLAKRIGITPQSVGKLISGENNPKLSTLRKISEETNTPMQLFLDSQVSFGNNNQMHMGSASSAKLERENAYLRGQIDVLKKLLKEKK